MLKKDNRGLTLVELIVAITILSIIVTPLLRAFVLSAQTNAKAKEQLRATEIAENIMERLDTINLETLAEQANYTSDFSDLFVPSSSTINMKELKATTNASGELVYSPVSTGEVPDYLTNPEDIPGWAVTASVTKVAGTTNYKFLGQTGHKYYFAMSGLSFNGSKDYDALLTLVADTDTATGSNYVNESGVTTSINQGALTSIDSISSSNDAIVMSPATPSSIMGEISGETGVSDQSKVVRNTIIDISKSSGAGGVSSTMVRVKYTFTVTKAGGTVTFPSAGSPNAWKYEDVVFSAAGDSTRELNNIYLFMMPWYSSTNAASFKDIVTINNPDHVDVDVFLVKQYIDASSSTLVNENAYKVKVNVVENLTSSQNPSLKIHSNLMDNVDPSSNATTKRLSTDPLYLYLDGTQQVGASAKLTAQDTLTTTKSSDRLLSVEVSIYKDGAYNANFAGAEPIVTLTGGMVN